MVPILSNYELVGGKVKAFFSRVKVRDLYDISNLAGFLDGISDAEQREMFHKTILYDAALSAAFPFGFEGREQRFVKKSKEIEAELYPMLRAEEAKPPLKTLVDSAAGFIDRWVVPKDEGELEFMNRFTRGEFEPELVFGKNDISSRTLLSPEAAWKLANIKKMEKLAPQNL